MPKDLTYIEAIREALAEEMRRDGKVFVLGEDVGAYGGAFGATQGLHEEFGDMRVVDTPISESAIVGISIGAALRGYRRRQPRHLFRAQVSLSPRQRTGSGRRRDRADRRRENPPRRPRHHAADLWRDGDAVTRSGRHDVERGYRGRGD